jgi:hypothetical protein
MYLLFILVQVAQVEYLLAQELVAVLAEQTQ